MINKNIDIENLISVMNLIKRRTPWFYVLYAFIISVMRRNHGNRTRTVKDISMPIRTLRFKFGAMEVLGFTIPKSEREYYEQVQANGKNEKTNRKRFRVQK